MPAKPVRIVIADSDTKSRTNLKEMLTKINYIVVGEARYGTQTVALVKKLNPDLIIINTDTLSGAVAAVQQISNARLSPIIILTNFSNPAILPLTQNSSVLACLNCQPDERIFFSTIEIILSRWEEIIALENELASVKDLLESRKLVDRAKGILMDTLKFSEEESYKRIRQFAMSKRLTIKEVAESIINAAKKNSKES